MDISIFSKRLRDTRREKNITQAQLAKMSGVTAATISAYESTDSKKGCNPSLENAAKLAEALSVSLDWLCGSVVNKDKVDTVDFLRMLVKMSENTGVSVDDVDIEDYQMSKIVTNACDLFSDEEYMMNDQYCENNNIDLSWHIPLVGFEKYYIRKFLSEWQKMKALYESNTIDESLYRLWLDKQFSDIEQKEKEEEEHRKELEQSLNKGGD